MAPSPLAAGVLSDPPAKPLRADAKRNRENLLQRAAIAFGEHGADASLEDIARKAGVGIGTLYRHFPTRDALVMAVYQDQIDRLVDAAEQLGAAPDAAIALRTWMDSFVGYALAKQGLIVLLKAIADRPSDYFETLRERIRSAAQGLIDRAADAGQVRSDIDASNLIRALGGICMASPGGGTEPPSKLVELVFDGLRFGAPGHPVPPGSRTRSD